MAFEVTIIGLTNETGTSPKGPYTYQLLSYDFKGESREVKIFSTLLKKYPNLTTELKAIKAGDRVGLEMKKNEKGYNELAEIVMQANIPTTASAAKSTTPTRSYSNDDKDTSIRVMNSMNNACQTLGEKVTIQQIGTRAWELILLGERLKTRLTNGDHLKNNTDPEDGNYNHDINPDYNEEEDVPF